MGKEDEVYIVNGILFSHKKGGDPAICDMLDGPKWHYARWVKADRKRQILRDLMYMWNYTHTHTHTQRAYRYKEQIWWLSEAGFWG